MRDRAPQAWPDIFAAIVRLIDNLEPGNRPRAIAFIAAFPDFWPQLQEATRTALQATVNNAVPAALTDYRILAGVTVPQFRAALLAVIAGLDREHLVNAVASQPLADLWPRAVEEYQGSGSWRRSDANFSDLITPFAGRLNGQQLDRLLDAVIDNGQNWDAAETDSFCLLCCATRRPPTGRAVTHGIASINTLFGCAGSTNTKTFSPSCRPTAGCRRPLSRRRMTIKPTRAARPDDARRNERHTDGAGSQAA